MKRTLQFIIFTLLTTVNLWSQSTLNDFIKEAGDENTKGNYTRAIELYSHIIALDPNEAKWYYYRGQDYSMLSDNKNAEKDYSKAIALSPQYFDAYLSRAIVYHSVNEPERSINDYNQALRYFKGSDKSFVYNNRGNAKALRNDLQGAYNDFIRAYAIDAQSITTLDNLGKILNRMQRGEEALFYFKRMMEIDTINTMAQSELAYTLLNLHRFQESIDQYNIVLTRSPDSPLALSNRGLAKMNLLDYEGALKDADQAIALYPQNAYTYRNRGMIKVAINKNTEGCADFKEALNLGFTQKYDTEVEEFYKHYCTSTKF